MGMGWKSVVLGLVCAAAGGLPGGHARAQAAAPAGDAVINWAIYDLAPSYFVQSQPGPQNLGEGIGDRLLAMLIKAMPEYKHQVALMTMPRVLAEMRAAHPVCVLNVLRSPERAQVSYSTPVLITPGPQLALNVHLLERHPGWRNGVSLAEITSDPTLQGQYLSGRSFGTKLDAIVHAPANVGLRPNGSATASSALRMIDLKRADYTIEYPELVALRVQRGEISADVTTVPIVEGDAFLDAYVLCTRSAWGQGVMRRIDAELQKLAATRDYQQALARWLSAQEQQRHQHDYERFYQMRARTAYCRPDCP